MKNAAYAWIPAYLHWLVLNISDHENQYEELSYNYSRHLNKNIEKLYYCTHIAGCFLGKVYKVKMSKQLIHLIHRYFFSWRLKNLLWRLQALQIRYPQVWRDVGIKSSRIVYKGYLKVLFYKWPQRSPKIGFLL